MRFPSFLFHQKYGVCLKTCFREFCKRNFFIFLNKIGAMNKRIQIIHHIKYKNRQFTKKSMKTLKYVNLTINLNHSKQTNISKKGQNVAKTWITQRMTRV